MVELQTKLTASGVLYIPRPIREAFGRRMKIIPDASAALFFPVDTSYEDVLNSLEIITADVQHRMKIAKRRQKEEAKKRMFEGGE